MCSIGYLMARSGLEEALLQVYGENAVMHMMCEKAVARALWGHMLVDSALNMILMEEMFTAEKVNTQPKVDDKGSDEAEDVILLDLELPPLKIQKAKK